MRRSWPDEELALLGTMPDDDLAALLGRTAVAVKVRRIARGVPVFVEPADCLVCGVRFRPTRPSAVLCSPECRAERKREFARTGGEVAGPKGGRKLERRCEECGKPFVGGASAVACSRRCRESRKRRLAPPPKTAACIACGAEFAVVGRRRYTCSPTCSRVARLNNNRRANVARDTTAQVEARRRRVEAEPAYREAVRETDRASYRRRAQRDAAIDLLRMRANVDDRADDSGGPGS